MKPQHYTFKLFDGRELEVFYYFTPSEKGDGYLLPEWPADVQITKIEYKGREVTKAINRKENASVWEEIENEILAYEGEGELL